MTAAAIILCWDVVDRLRECDPRVVAGCTIVGVYPHVAEYDSGKAVKVVDVVAVRAVQHRG